MSPKGQGVRLGEGIQRERRQRVDDLIRGDGGGLVRDQPLAQLRLHFLHPLLIAFEVDGPAEFVGLASREVRQFHGDAEQLFLKEHHAVGALEYRFEPWVPIRDGLATGPPFDQRVDRLALDGAGADDRDLHRDIIEGARLEARQARHLRAGFDLEETDCVGLAEHVVGRGIILGHVRQVDGHAAVLTELERFLDGLHHAEAEEIHFDQPHVLAIGFCPTR